jgi:hypothetical protein
LVLGLGRKEAPTLPLYLKDRIYREARSIARQLKLDHVELEAWPAHDAQARWRWTYARYREDGRYSWKWLDSRDFRTGEANFPKNLSIADAREFGRIFNDFLRSKDLYKKPLFSECVWTDVEGKRSAGAWFSPERIGVYREKLAAQSSDSATAGLEICHAVPQPARFNPRPVTFVVRASSDTVEFAHEPRWSETVRYSESDSKKLDSPELGDHHVNQKSDSPVIRGWPTDMGKRYRADIEFLAGPRFIHKNSADENNRILDVIRYLEHRYAKLGIKTHRQSFDWKRIIDSHESTLIPQANLIAVIPGRGPRHSETPVLLADHIDTAFSEDAYKRTRERISAPGADDNASATAALLAAATVLKDYPLKHDVWLVHLTGEEYPADCLGARHFVSTLLRGKRDIKALLLMDMIAYRDSSDPVFQINAGRSQASVTLAKVVYSAATAVAPSLEPRFRSRFDEKSYLYNTDGIIFSEAGYPVVLLNEHINKLENFGRPYYHQTTDLPVTLDFEYALSIVKTAIETAARLAL